ncbi:DUF1254 domain-containing protein [Flavobacterium laiguense]|nr:DUF1254 domain-containing protein [Flavobacterium laiguense]
MDFQRACQAYIWGIPAVALSQFKKASNDIKVSNGQFIIFATFESKLGIITPNYTTPYVATVADLEKSGPVVIELPKGLMAGMALDAWQRVLTDLGAIGPDKGEGGKYLFVGPGQTVPKVEGYHVIQSPTFNIFYGVRLLDADEKKAIAELTPLIKSYPYSERNNIPKEQTEPLGEVKWSQIQPHGMEYWERLADVVQQEPVEERDRFFMAQLRFLGIEKGKPFNPTAEQKQILLEAEKVGELMVEANSSDKRFAPSYWSGTSWKDAVVSDVNQRSENYEQLDERSSWAYEAFTISRGMKSTTPGFGQRYMVTYTDKGGDLLDGGKNYVLHVPSNPPATQFWSVTAYDETTRSFVVSATKKTDLSSRRKSVVTNADGSVDVYFGPTEPKGHENNWVQTVAGKGWFPYFRFYGPTEAVFNKSWQLKDIEKVK